MLHVTNGHSVSLREAGMTGDVLVWLDVLHEGPVPAGLSLEQMTRVRGAYLEPLWPGAAAALAERDARLGRFREHEEVVLWFEHDLYDQLQLIQLLDFFREHPPARLSLISIDRYLGLLRPDELAELWPLRRAVTDEQLELGATAWRAFCSPDPAALEALARNGTPALPHLAGALERHLQQFPAADNGLSRSQRQILEAVAGGARDFAAIFRADQEREERIFLGDATLWLYLEDLAGCRHPLLRREGDEWYLTGAGRDVLDGRAHHIQLNGIDRWLGGVHLQVG